MKRVKFLFVLFLLFQYITDLNAQVIQSQSENLLSNQKNYLHTSNKNPDTEPIFYLDNKLDKHFIQSDGDYLLETLTRQIWEESSSSWVNDSFDEYSYNDINLLDTIIVSKRNNGGVLENAYKETFSYDSIARISFSNEWYWNGGWEEYYRYYYSFSSNNNLLYINKYTWANPGWLYINKYSYNWNSLNDTTRITLEGLDMFHGGWRYFWKVEFSYDSLNSLITKDKFDYYSQNNWRPELRDQYFYDNNRNNIENIRLEWNSTDSIWVNVYRYSYEYDSNNILISTLYQDWQTDSSNWVNVWRETYTYTPQNKLTTMFKETWSTETGWQNYALRTYYYDNNDNWTEKLTQLWDGSDWKNYYRHLATWLKPVSVKEEQVTLISYYLYNNFPNPFNPSTKIKFKIPGQARNDNTMVSLKVYDILGKEIAVLVNEEKPSGEYEVELSGMNLPTGIYFYTLRAGNFSETKKMILLK